MVFFHHGSLTGKLLLFPASLLSPHVPSLHVVELVGADPVQGVRHAHHDRPSGHVALDPRCVVLVLHLHLHLHLVPDSSVGLVLQHHNPAPVPRGLKD